MKRDDIPTLLDEVRALRGEFVETAKELGAANARIEELETERDNLLDLLDRIDKRHDIESLLKGSTPDAQRGHPKLQRHGVARDDPENSTPSYEQPHNDSDRTGPSQTEGPGGESGVPAAAEDFVPVPDALGGG